LDEKAWRATEPHTPSPAARLDAVAELRARGIDSGVLIAPLMPGINDDPEQVQPLVERAKEAGATFLGGLALHLRGEVKDVFFGWLEAQRPDLLPRYEELYKGRAYMRPEDRKHATRALKGWGRSGVRKNSSRQGASRAGPVTGGEAPCSTNRTARGTSPPVSPAGEAVPADSASSTSCLTILPPGPEP
jgi:DNA repair photolyase